VCATSQAVNDWFDRHVDAINEPHRPIPSGRMPGRWGLYIAIGWTGAVAAGGAGAGPLGLRRRGLGLLLAWAYSAPPLRLKRNGWWGNAACAAELRRPGLGHRRGRDGLAAPCPAPLAGAGALYSAGAHGIMTLNDFKSVEGRPAHGHRLAAGALGIDARGAHRLPDDGAAAGGGDRPAAAWGAPVHAGGVALLLLAQAVLMARFLKPPEKRALWYSGFGVPLFVLGMMVSAFALRSLAGVAP
jgi:chlorophyll/bacteriochlorophyll a synthase